MMKSYLGASWVWAMLSITAASATSGVTVSQPARDLVRAVARDDCDAVARLANEGMKSNDAQAIFLIGRMIAEGVCVPADGAAATPYFAHAAAQGFGAAEIEYGLQTGLGAGAEQSYERAGDLCQKGGLEQQGGGSSLYSLGYVCTVRGLASRRLRVSLPHGALLPGRAARVSFNPVSGVMQIRTTPRVATVHDTTTGTFVERPTFDAQASIGKAWRWALDAAPKPDAARLENQAIELNLDLDITIEGGTGNGHSEGQPTNGTLMPADVRPPPVPGGLGH
ncbi:MAG TPA: hypothetical protein VNX02_06335 [Steroidobacteraceae bacterium]|jgi:hypothetical protein|nr:hypothetical protein [Steroidobacteraceae bacterium]